MKKRCGLNNGIPVMLMTLHSYCSMGNELQEARSSEDDLEHPPTKKNKRDLAEDSHGKSWILFRYR